MDFQFAYQTAHGGNWADLSAVLYWNNEVAALWPLSFSRKDGGCRFSSQGMPVLPPVFVKDCPAVSRKKIIKACMDTADEYCRLQSVEEWSSQDAFGNQLGISEWHQESLARDIHCTLEYDLLIDLSESLDTIKSRFRRSYKPLISKGLKTWDVRLLAEQDEETWQEFKELHKQVSGRVTRSDRTWELHHNDIGKGKGFLVCLYNGSGIMDGAGFFNLSRDEGLYSVAAYKRELFDQPMGHVVQYVATGELIRRGVRWYKLGNKPQSTDANPSTAKEYSIADFKQGFATNIMPRYRFSHLRTT